jgi:PAS domain S-box-containing protein
LKQTRSLIVYIFLVLLLGGSLFIFAVLNHPPKGDLQFWLLFATLLATSIACRRYTIHTDHHIDIEIGSIPLFVAALLFPAGATMIIAAVHIGVDPRGKKLSWLERLSDLGRALVSTGICVTILNTLSASPWKPEEALDWVFMLLAALTATLMHLLISTGWLSLTAQEPFLVTARKLIQDSLLEHAIMLGIAVLTALLVIAHPWMIAIVLLIAFGVYILIQQSQQNLVKLAESEARYQGLFATNQVPILIIEPETEKIVDANQAAVEFYKFGRSDLIGQTIIQLRYRRERESPVEFTDFGMTDHHFITRHVLADGEIRDLEVYSGAMPVHGQVYTYYILHDITERQQQQRRTETISDISGALQSVHVYSDLLNVLIDKICHHLGSDSAALILLEASGEKLSVAIGRGVMAALTGQRLTSRAGVIGAVLSTGQPVINNEPIRDTYLSVFVDMSAIRYAACIPLIVQESKIGVLWIGRTLTAKIMEPYTQEEIALLCAIGEISANSIHRTTLHEQTRRNAEQMKAISLAGNTLAEVLELSDIYERLNESLHKLFPDLSSVFISLYDPVTDLVKCEFGIQDGNRLDLFNLPMIRIEPTGRGSKSEVIRTRKPLIVNDLQPRQTKMNTSFLVGTQGHAPQSGIYAPMITKGEILGVIQVQSYKINRFSPSDAELLCMIGNIAAVAIQNARLIDNLEVKNLELVQSYDATLQGWSNALELRDQETEGHSERVVQLTVQVATRMGISLENMVHIRRGALLHDIGKIGIPDSILNKPGPLTEQEWGIMKRHPVYAYELLRHIGYLRPAIEIPYCHHEKWDGSGYPRGLKGENIPIAARIFTIADVWDALRNDRPYRKAWSASETIAYIREQSGHHFDPGIVQEFEKVVRLDGYVMLNEKQTNRFS